MANLRYTIAQRNSMMDTVRTSLSGGSIQIRSGTQPANADAVTAGTLLATLPLATPAGASSSSGTFTFGTITSDSSADNSGTATWARIFQSDATTVVCDCDVGTSGATINLNTTTIVAGGTVALTSGTLSIPAT